MRGVQRVYGLRGGQEGYKRLNSGYRGLDGIGGVTQVRRWVKFGIQGVTWVGGTYRRGLHGQRGLRVE